MYAGLLRELLIVIVAVVILLLLASLVIHLASAYPVVMKVLALALGAAVILGIVVVALTYGAWRSLH